MGLAMGLDATDFVNSAAFIRDAVTFTFPAGARSPEAEVTDLTPSVGALGSGLDLDPALGVKTWCWGEELGPAPGDPDLLSACNTDSHSGRASDEAGPDFPEEDQVPVKTGPGQPEIHL